MPHNMRLGTSRSDVYHRLMLDTALHEETAPMPLVVRRTRIERLKWAVVAGFALVAACLMGRGIL